MGYGAMYSDGWRDGNEDRFDRGLADWRVILDDERLAIHIDSGGRTSVHKRDVLVMAPDAVVDDRFRDNYRDIGVSDGDYDDLRGRLEDPNTESPGFVTMTVGRNQCVVAATKFLRALGGRRPLRVAPDNVLWPFQGRGYGPDEPPEWAPAPAGSLLGQQKQSAEGHVSVAVIDTGYIAGVNPELDALTNPNQADADPWYTNGQMSHWVGGHGTHVAGVLAGAAGGQVELNHFEVNVNGISLPLVSDTELADALSKALTLGCRVINMSLGGPTALDLGLPAVSLVIRSAAGPIGEESAGTRDAVIVVSAGNEDTSQPMFPAASKGVVGVGALNADFTKADFSNYGPWVDCATVGVDVVGPYVPGLLAPPAGIQPSPAPNPWAAWSGTSFAAPYVAGRIAAVLASGVTSARVAAATVLAGGVPLDPTMQLGVRIP